MIKKTLITFFLLVLLSVSSYSAGTSSSSDSNSSDYTKAVKYVKAAKKYENDGKTEKANNRYMKALKLLIKSNKSKPNKADTLNYLGFTTRKLGDYENGEKYYLQGLAIEPNHIGINEYLGELYVATNRIDLANERLKILESCNCKEYDSLKQIIAGTKKSKY
jgi:tetratricopeptide (TPR) repeat protein